jgi:hypothetical protein
MQYGHKKIVVQRREAVIKYQVGNLASLFDGSQRRSIRTKCFLQPVADSKLFIMGITARSGPNKSHQWHIDQPRPGTEDSRCSQGKASHDCQTDQTANQTNASTRRKYFENPGILQARKVSNTILLQRSSRQTGQKQRFSRFSYFFLEQNAASMSFSRPRSCLTPRTSHEIFSRTLSISHSGTFRRLRRQIGPFSLKVRGCLNRLRKVL